MNYKESSVSNRVPSLLLTTALIVLTSLKAQSEEIVLAETPTVSPNGKQIAFSYGGDIWLASSKGGLAKRITFHSARDTSPQFSPNGRRIAFVSDRRGANHAYTMDLADLAPKQVSYHSEGCTLAGWYSDGKGLLAHGRRDHHWRYAERFWRIDLEKESPEEILFDAYGSEGSLSRDGRYLLFTREGERWWRLGYHGARSAQIWMYDLKEEKFTKMLDRDHDCRWPVWRPDGRGFYFVHGDHDGYDLYLQELDPKSKQRSGDPKKLVDMDHGSITFPTLSRNGRTLVFRHLGDLYRVNPTSQSLDCEKIPLRVSGDGATNPVVRRTLRQATEVEFTADGLEVAMVAGGDVWVMDTVLREPVRITDSPFDESNLVFDNTFKRLYLVQEIDGKSDIWYVEREDAKKHWWQNTKFKFTRVTNNEDYETYVRLSADGKNLFYVSGRGELWVRPVSGSGEPKKLVDGFDRPDYDISPDGKWVAYSHSDDNFNRDVWIVAADGSTKPFNVTRHPDDEWNPRWSPDGRLLAFTGRRGTDSEVDIFYVWLQEAEDDVSSRDRKLKSALTKMRARDRSTIKGTSSKKGIDFASLNDRLHRVRIPDATESSLRWSPDSRRLAFRATIKGTKAIYAISIPTSLSPSVVSSTDGTMVGWLKNGTLLLSVSGVPTTVGAKGEKASYTFSVQQEFSRAKRYRAAFEVAWRTMRDHWYDENLGNRDWSKVREVYGQLAEAAADPSALRTTIELMLGELNGSHLGFYPSVAPRRVEGWTDVTPHLGIRFDPSHEGEGLKVRDVIHDGPADREGKPQPGDRVIQINGQAVDTSQNFAKRFSGPLTRDMRLTIVSDPKPVSVEKDKLLPPWEGHEREVNEKRWDLVVRPTTYGTVRTRLYTMWLDHNRREVERLSNGKLGYLHIRAMDMNSFTEFERQLYYVGYGKDGLVIDVRENGGGSTTDLLLTALTQPQHAITVPRGGGPGYPQSRMVYATWNKPIIVMCNQNSYSNAEIFSHAIKGLKRGRLVGTPTAGGVISTSTVRIMDVGTLRFPFRGWFVGDTGEDMELNGAVPDVIVWPQPGEIPQGIDRQLETAVKLLEEDVAKWRKRPRPKLRLATERMKELDE